MGGFQNFSGGFARRLPRGLPWFALPPAIDPVAVPVSGAFIHRQMENIVDKTSIVVAETRTIAIAGRLGRRSRKTGRAASLACALALVIAAAMPGMAQAQAQCTPLLSGLRLPVGSVLTDHGRLLIAEAGDGSSGSGRISILDRDGSRRTLVAGLPSGTADVGTPSGPSGMFMRGRSLYLAMGTGDTGVMGPRPGTTLENLHGPSSPIFSSVLAMHFSADAEHRTSGFTLTAADEQALAEGRLVSLHDSHQNSLSLRMLTKFPNFVHTPVPGVPDNISLSNPFGVAGLGSSVYVTDGGRNLAWKVDRQSGAAEPLASFADIPNPLFPLVGGPFMQAVPTGITVVQDKLLVSLLRGAPFATGTAVVEQLDTRSGTFAPLISNLTTAMGTIVPREPGHGLLVLEYSSAGPFFSGPGTVLQFDTPAGPPTKVADCLARPTSMTLDRRDGILYVTEEGGNLVGIPMP